MKEMWDKRYAEKEYAYGTLPNRYFFDQIRQLKPGKILLPAEGEGRNAVFAGQYGWEVSAFDISREGMIKCRILSAGKPLKIDYGVYGYEDMQFEKESFDCIALIYAHVPWKMQQIYYPKLLSYLKKGGTVILEGFSDKQLGNDSGGPKDPDFLYTEDKLNKCFGALSNLSIKSATIKLDEGKFHQGKADVIQLLGTK